MMDRVSEFLGKAAAQPVELTIRDLLAIWGYRARTYDSVGRIQRDLSAAGLQCQPDFSDGAAETMVRISVVGAAQGAEGSERCEAGDRSASSGRIGPDAGSVAEDQPLEFPHVALLVGDIPSSKQGITSINPGETLELAQAVMMTSDYSQLAVMTGPRDLKGSVSWRSIARARVRKSHIELTDVIDAHPRVVYMDEELLGQIGVIYEADYVFVRDSNDYICGIVTTADLSACFRDLTTPFFQLGEIEGRLRRCISHVFSIDELRQVVRQPRLKSVNNMTFGQYVVLLQEQGRWQRLHWGVDCEMFIEQLDDVRMIRNRVMHFGVALRSEDKKRLLRFLNFMRDLDPLP
jgi:hypothetical protein